MGKKNHILVINVGSTSTKVAFFEETTAIAAKTITYESKDLAQYTDLKDQLSMREEDLLGFTKEQGITLGEVDMVVSRGGLGKPAPAGAYGIDDGMCDDLLAGKYGKHPSALGPAMALDLKKTFGIPAIVIDPPSTDEFHPLARVSGLPEIQRKSAFHALNQKTAARRAAAGLEKRYEDINLVVAHLGGGITIGAHKKGRVIDCTHGLSEGPMTPERAGCLPSIDLVDLALSGRFERKQLMSRLVGQGGLVAYLDTSDARKIQDMIKKGDTKAADAYRAMAYQIAKDIGAMHIVLKGKTAGIVLTGGLAHSAFLTDLIEEWVRCIAPVFIYPGEDEMEALAAGALRALRGEEEVKRYGEP